MTTTIKSLVILIAAATICLGCQSMNDSRKAVNTHFRKAGSQMAESTKNMLAWEPSTVPREFEWDWVAAIPASAIRADQVKTEIDQDSVASLLPQLELPRVAQVSTAPTTSFLKIEGVEDKKIRDFAELNQVTEKIGSERQSNSLVSVQLGGMAITPMESTEFAGSAETIEMSVAQLSALAHLAQPDESAVVQPIDGHQWVFLKSDGLSCRLLVRVERSTGLIHVIMTGGLHWGDSIPFPDDIIVTCDGSPSNCLSVAETLQVLYDDKEISNKSEEKPVTPWETKAVLADYLIPTNFKKLNERQTEIEKHRPTKIRAAFASMPGIGYPGPAVLGDARALSMFVMTPSELDATNGFQTGWVVFQNELAKDKCRLTVEVAIGAERHSVEFILPEK